MEQEFYFFWKHRFGQWTMRDMVVDGVTYCCCEQYMMAEKARLFSDDVVLAKIMASRNPKQIKDLGREVKGMSGPKWDASDKAKWDAAARPVVVKGNMAKFSQHDDLKGMLLSTLGKILVEASPSDTIWGIGLVADDPRAMDMKQWRGTNWLGYALMDVRDELARNQCPVTA
jgi:ribA/ribD-fused uncharacterized protein